MKQIGISGSFDPFTLGHLELIREASNIADRVVIMLAENPAKTGSMTVQQKKDVIKEVMQDEGIIDFSIEILTAEYTARWAKEHGIDYIARGLRDADDLKYEMKLHETNSETLGGAKSLFFVLPRHVSGISSSFVKSLVGPIGWHREVQKFLPSASYDAFVKNWLLQKWNEAFDYYQTVAPHNSTYRRKEFDHIIDTYSDYSRAYHNVDHLVHGLTELSRFTDLDPGYKADITLAFFFHDIVYRAKDPNNSDEKLSADYFMSIISGSIPSPARDRVCELIRHSEHGFKYVPDKYPTTDTRSIQIMKDIDLAILGQNKEWYNDYATCIQLEYSEYLPTEFYAGRIKVLKAMLKSITTDTLFLTPELQARYVGEAYLNLDMELSNLSARLKMLCPELNGQ